MATAQTIANTKWKEKNKEYSKYLSNRSRTRSFLRNKSTLEDLEEFKELIKSREEVLEEIDKKVYYK